MLFDRFGKKVGVRYLTARRGSSFLSVISFISVGGVAVGVLAMIVVLSVMLGFEHEMKKRLFKAETHVRIENPEGVFSPDSSLLNTIKSSDSRVKDAFPVLQTEVILKSGRRVAGALIKGVSPKQLDRMKENVGEWAPTAFLADASSLMLIGQELAFELGVVPGDKVTVVSPIEVEGPFGAVPRVKQFVVEGIYKTGVPEQELHDVFTPVANVESFLRQKNVLSQIEVRVDDLENAPAVSEVLKTSLGSGFLVRSWHDLNAHLVGSLKLERAAMSFMLAFIVVVATFNILSVLTMTVIEKKKSLSILRAMGATRRQIAGVVLWQGFTIAVIGCLIGTVFGVGVCLFIQVYPIIPLPDIYYDRTVPVRLQPLVIGTILLVATLIVLIGAYVPARKASQLTPLSGIRE